MLMGTNSLFSHNHICRFWKRREGYPILKIVWKQLIKDSIRNRLPWVRVLTTTVLVLDAAAADNIRRTISKPLIDWGRVTNTPDGTALSTASVVLAGIPNIKMQISLAVCGLFDESAMHITVECETLEQGGGGVKLCGTSEVNSSILQKKIVKLLKP